MNIKRFLLSLILILTLLILGCMTNKDKYPEKDKKEGEKVVEEHHKGNEEPIKELIDEIELQINNMTLKEKIGQLILVGMDGYEINDNIEELIKSYNVGGIILYGKNVKDSNQLLSLINSLKDTNSSNKVPLFISVDEEGGSVSRVPEGIKKLPTARSIGKTQDSSLAFKAGELLGKTVKTFGYNMDFAPVLDIDSNPLNPVIGDRAYGQTVEIVSSLGIEILNGIKEEGVIPVIKHFPGHGDTTVDSHIELPVLDYDLERIMNFEVVPFKHAIDSGAEVVMVAHILLPQIDPKYPASMSNIVITHMLRNKLKFKGIVITDDMTMGAIKKNYNIGNAAVQSIKVGADIILVGHNYKDSVEVFSALKESVEKGAISTERLYESVYRILKLKEQYGLQDKTIKKSNIEEINKEIDNLIENAIK